MLFSDFLKQLSVGCPNQQNLLPGKWTSKHTLKALFYNPLSRFSEVQKAGKKWAKTA